MRINRATHRVRIYFLSNTLQLGSNINNFTTQETSPNHTTSAANICSPLTPNRAATLLKTINNQCSNGIIANNTADITNNIITDTIEENDEEDNSVVDHVL